MAKIKTGATTKKIVNLVEVKKACLVLRSLNHEGRKEIIELIHSNKQMMVTDIYRQLKMEQSLTSSFLSLLRKAGAVNTRREGQAIYYSLNYERLLEIEKGIKIIIG
jgi:DNA-binding transcriptional ArsR family regulator